YAFYDQTGALVAPTLTGPVSTTIGPLSAATLYTPFFAEMPVGFQGSFLATVVSSGADAPVAAVSNNVNYDVVGDGTAAYNAFLAGALELEPTRFEAEPEFATNPVTDADGDPVSHTVTVTVFDQFGDPLPGVGVCVDVVSGPNAGAGDCGSTDANGQSAFTYWPNGTLGTDAIRVWVDLDADGVVDDGETDTLIKEWVLGEARVLDVEQTCESGSTETGDCTNTLATQHTITATLTDGAGNPVEGVQVLADITAGPNAGEAVVCTETGVDGVATCTYTDANASDGDTDTILVWADLDGLGDPDAEEPQAEVTKTWVAAVPLRVHAVSRA
ncbi:Ig-like domain-containing protein, partial [Thermomicrobiaceae bacterium CFH 74404]